MQVHWVLALFLVVSQKLSLESAVLGEPVVSFSNSSKDLVFLHLRDQLCWIPWEIQSLFHRIWESDTNGKNHGVLEKAMEKPCSLIGSDSKNVSFPIAVGAL